MCITKNPRSRAVFDVQLVAIIAVLQAIVSASTFTNEFPITTPQSLPLCVTTGNDGAVWFVETGASKIGRITTSGQLTEFVIPTPNSFPRGITVGPDGEIW